MAYVNIDMDDIRTWELIDELENRYLSDNERSDLIKLVKDADCDKIDFFLKVYKKYSLLELHEIFKEDASPIISENQLALQLK